jgi:hypothetical protein
VSSKQNLDFQVCKRFNIKKKVIGETFALGIAMEILQKKRKEKYSTKATKSLFREIGMKSPTQKGNAPL